MKKIVAILMAMLLVMSVTIALAGGAKDVNPEADAGLTEFTQEKGSQDIESAYDDEQIRIECKFAKPVVERGEYDRVKVKSLRNLGNPGEPILPFKTLTILLPQGKTVQSIEVTGTQNYLLGEYRVEHGQEPVPVGSKSKSMTLPDSAIYESANPFPGKMFTKASIQELRGYRILILNLYPVQYIPKAGKISYFESMHVIVDTAPDTISSNFRGLPQDRVRVLDVVDNPEIVETYETSPQSAFLTEGSYDYVIITNNELSGEFQTLATWKNDKSVNTTVATLETDIAGYPGDDPQEQVRNFIIDAYNTWGITYVLLGGDVEIIPNRNFYVQTSRRPRDSYSIPSDLYYAGLDGTWDNDGDDRYGETVDEMDLYAEVYVGRAPVNTGDEASTFVNKTIAYEDNPPADYLKNALMLGAKLDADTDGGKVKDSICADKIPDDWSVTKLYERYGNASVLTTTQKLNTGQHVVNNIGHANENVIGLACEDYEEYYTITDVEELQNAQRYFLFYTIGCYANAFDYDDCIGEHFVNNSNGAFAFIGNTRYGWYISGYPSEGPSNRFDIEFFDALFVEDITNIGKTLQHSKEDLTGSALTDPYMRFCYYELTLLGDPETSLATVPTGPQAPKIIGYAPESPVDNVGGEERTFNITVDQTVNVSWQINGTEVLNPSSETESTYTNTSAVIGTWNVSAIVDNVNGTDMQTWIWNVIPPDSAPPVISNVTASDITSSSATITWDTDEPADSLVKYGTELGNYANNVSDSTSVTSHAIDLTELEPSTTYYYVVNSTDLIGNSEQSPEYNFTTNEALGNTMHVASIIMSTDSRSVGRDGRNTFVGAVATVTIFTESGSPVEGATVSGYWSGATSDSDSGVTDVNGQVSLKSDEKKNPASGTTFTFTVDNVVLSGLTYDPDASETSDSITVP